MGAALIAVAALGLGACGGGTDDGSASGATRTLDTVMGEVEIPQNPEKVVVLDTDKIDTALTLGVTPVGAARAGETELPGYLDGLEGVETVGTLTDPDLEKIEQLRPDLILGTQFRQEQFYDELTAIAPTVFTENVGVTWKENFLLDGDALGKKEEAEQKLAAYERRAEEFGQSLGDPSETTVSIVRFMPDHIRYYGPEGFSGIVVADTGLARTELQEMEGAEDRRFGRLSAEEIDRADADYLFYTAYGEDAEKAQGETTQSALWTSMTAVGEGRSFNIDDEVWMTGIGVTAANMILDDLEKHVQA